MKGKTKNLIKLVRRANSWTSKPVSKINSKQRKERSKDMLNGDAALEELKRRKCQGKDPEAVKFFI